jgi:hypothetical protein
MMGAKHTPGPWTAVEDELVPERGCIYVEAKDTFGSSDMETIAEAYKLNSFDTEQQEANARLIAAAPTMLEALRAVVGALGPLKPTQETLKSYQLAEAAIAKAEGRS